MVFVGLRWGDERKLDGGVALLGAIVGVDLDSGSHILGRDADKKLADIFRVES